MAEVRIGRESERMLSGEITADGEDVCCFGMILGLHLTPFFDFVVHETPVSLSVSEDSRTLTEVKSTSVFGILTRNSQKIIEILQRETTIQTFADRIPSRSNEPSEGSRKVAKQAKSRPSLELCVILYGPFKLSQHVSAFAARCQLYLQQPRHCNIDVPYRNPQSLPPEDDRIVFTCELNDTANDSEPSFEISANPIDLFADVSVQDTLTDADTPRALSTELYKHQKQALTFMLQRELGWALDGHPRDIWKEEHDTLGRISYQNVISGLKQPTIPRPFKGGLLIDAPGLGKSLSILALIAASIERHNRDTATISCRMPTLIVVPKTLIQMWKDELQKHLRTATSMEYCVYYGKDRTHHLKELQKYALVITTYSVVRLDWKKWLAEPGTQSTLHAVNWERIVLDEAHIIREPSKSFAKSVCALQADKRWAVTGTPIQNRLTDLFSLFKYLQCYPFDDLRIFNAQVTQKWKARSDPECVAKLKTLVNCLSLRRPKTTIELLPRTDDVEHLNFSAQEWQNYQRVKSTTLSSFNSIEACNREKRGVSFLNALKWVNELRLICNHGIRSPPGTKEAEHVLTVWDQVEAQKRFDQLDDLGLAKCSVSTCDQDLSSLLSSEGDMEHQEEPWINDSLEIWCCLCVKNKTAKAYRVCNHLPRRRSTPARIDNNGIDFPEIAHSMLSIQCKTDRPTPLPTKVQKLVDDLLATPKNIKSVVFSSWTKTFDIIQPQLWAKSIRCVRLDGSLSASSRASVLRVFRTNSDITVLLATISCGGVGLDLTAASRAYIMEPQWNPMSESQALDRIYRLGQIREVKTKRYLMKGSWEEQVLKLQKRKQELAELTLDSGGIKKADLTYGRLQYLKDLVG